MEILSLIIKQKFFDEIIKGAKKQETREIRPKTNAKYCEIDEEGYVKEIDGVLQPRHYDAIRFYVGYNKDRASALVKVAGAQINLYVDENNEFITYEEGGKEYTMAEIVYDLGDIIEKNV